MTYPSHDVSMKETNSCSNCSTDYGKCIQYRNYHSLLKVTCLASSMPAIQTLTFFFKTFQLALVQRKIFLPYNCTLCHVQNLCHFLI